MISSPHIFFLLQVFVARDLAAGVALFEHILVTPFGNDGVSVLVLMCDLQVRTADHAPDSS